MYVYEAVNYAYIVFLAMTPEIVGVATREELDMYHAIDSLMWMIRLTIYR